MSIRLSTKASIRLSTKAAKEIRTLLDTSYYQVDTLQELLGKLPIAVGDKMAIEERYKKQAADILSTMLLITNLLEQNR